MDEELGCDFFFFDTIFQDIKQFDTSQLKGFKKNIHSVRLGIKSLLFHTGVAPIFNNNYNCYIVSGSSTYLINWLILLYGWITNKKVYIWCHGFHSQLKKKRSRLVARMFYASADGLLMYNSFYTPNMIDIGCRSERIFYIHNSLDTHKQSEIYKNLTPSSIYKNHFGNEWPTAIFIGRIQKSKRIDMLLKAVSKLRKEGANMNIVIVGDSTDNCNLKEMSKELELDDRIWFYGASYDEKENGQLLFDAAVCVCPERIGLTCIHSLTYGTPVVSNNDYEKQGPEFQAVKEWVTGSFYEKDNVESLSQHIWHWANVTTEERIAIRKNARYTIEKEWSVDYQINLLKKVMVNSR